MTYFNPVLRYGVDQFCRACAKAGVDGLIIPDLPPEEGKVLGGTAAQEGIDLIYLLSPASTAERIKIVAEKSRGYIYLVSVTGVTGARSTLSSGLGEFVARVRRAASQPLCVGFGVANGEQAQQIARIADGVIIGSRLIQLMKEDATFGSLEKAVKEIRAAIDGEE
jgi:tryptophan synthase alpha chain